MNKPILYFDMDNVLVDFMSGVTDSDTGSVGHFDEIPHVFSKMKPAPGAVDAVNILKDKYDVHVLSTVPWGNDTAASDKVMWLKKYFGDTFKKKVVFTHRKDLVAGDILIDDNMVKNGAGNFHGRKLWLKLFPSGGCTREDIENAGLTGIEECRSWNEIIDKLI